MRPLARISRNASSTSSRFGRSGLISGIVLTSVCSIERFAAVIRLLSAPVRDIRRVVKAPHLRYLVRDLRPSGRSPDTFAHCAPTKIPLRAPHRAFQDGVSYRHEKTESSSLRRLTQWSRDQKRALRSRRILETLGCQNRQLPFFHEKLPIEVNLLLRRG